MRSACWSPAWRTASCASAASAAWIPDAARPGAGGADRPASAGHRDLSGWEADKSIPLSELFVDVGRPRRRRSGRTGGDAHGLSGWLLCLGEDQMCGKSMDDRSCFVTLLRAAELLRDRELDVDLYLLGSTGGGLRAGATVGTWAVQPDFCVAVDVTHGKTPTARRTRPSPLAEVPPSAWPQHDRWMTDRMLAKAKKADSYQLEVMSGHTGTNGWEMQISREG
ncbi:MAG: hypothetical protein ACLRIS_01850 [Flavonifractor plautii]